jgi:hypothetical protein
VVREAPIGLRYNVSNPRSFSIVQFLLDAGQVPVEEIQAPALFERERLVGERMDRHRTAVKLVFPFFRPDACITFAEPVRKNW